jgi:hypothetical protein
MGVVRRDGGERKRERERVNPATASSLWPSSTACVSSSDDRRPIFKHGRTSFGWNKPGSERERKIPAEKKVAQGNKSNTDGGITELRKQHVSREHSMHTFGTSRTLRQ